MILHVNRKFDTELVTGKQLKTGGKPGGQKLKWRTGTAAPAFTPKMPVPIGSLISSARSGVI